MMCKTLSVQHPMERMAHLWNVAMNSKVFWLKNITVWMKGNSIFFYNSFQESQFVNFRAETDVENFKVIYDTFSRLASQSPKSGREKTRLTIHILLKRWDLRNSEKNKFIKILNFSRISSNISSTIILSFILRNFSPIGAYAIYAPNPLGELCFN